MKLSNESKKKVDKVIRSAATPEQKETAKRYRELADLLDKEENNPGIWIGLVVVIALGFAMAILLIALFGIIFS